LFNYWWNSENFMAQIYLLILFRNQNQIAKNTKRLFKASNIIFHNISAILLRLKVIYEI